MSHKTIYSTANLRKNLAEALACAYQKKEEVIDVMSHGRHCASLVSDESAELLRLIFQKLDKKSLHELKQIFDTIPEGTKVGLGDLTKIINNFEHYLAASRNTHLVKGHTERKRSRSTG